VPSHRRLPSPSVLIWLQLTADEDAALDAQSKAALSTARVLLVNANLDGSTGLSLELEAVFDAQARRGGVPTSWLSFGTELFGLRLGTEEESLLDSQSLAALKAAHVLRQRTGAEPTDAQKALGVPTRQKGALGSAWLQFGLELSQVGLSDSEVVALDGQSRAALAAARFMILRLGVGSGGLTTVEEVILDAGSKRLLAAARERSSDSSQSLEQTDGEAELDQQQGVRYSSLLPHPHPTRVDVLAAQHFTHQSRLLLHCFNVLA